MINLTGGIMENNKLEKMLTSFLERLDKIEDFAIEHAPDFVKDIVKVEYVKLQNQIIHSTIIFVIAATYIAGFFYFIGIEDSDNFGKQLVFGIPAIIAFLGVIGSIFDGINEILEYREMKASERLVAINGISKLLKGKF